MKDRAYTGFFVTLTIIIVSCSGNPVNNGGSESAQVPDTSRPDLVFREYSHDFGMVTEGEKVGYLFSFENKGRGNLVITSASASCGCTVPKYDSKPVPPGGSGNLEVVFDTSGREGKQTKSVTVASNASKPVILLQITAEVVSATDK